MLNGDGVTLDLSVRHRLGLLLLLLLLLFLDSEVMLLLKVLLLLLLLHKLLAAIFKLLSLVLDIEVVALSLQRLLGILRGRQIRSSTRHLCALEQQTNKEEEETNASVYRKKNSHGICG